MNRSFNRFAVLVLSIAGMVSVGWSGGQSPRATMRFHVQANEVLPKEQLVPIQLLNPPQLIYVRKMPEVTERHLESIERLPNGSVLLQLNQAGTGLLDGATSSYPGMILVVICNGRVVFDAVIDVPLRDGRFIIPSGITDEELVAFRRLIERNRRL